MGGARWLMAVGVVGLATVAAAEALKIEPGLWSVTYTYSVAGKPPAELLANLPPEKRAAMEKSWADKIGKPQTTTSDTCVTAEDLASGNGFGDNGEDEDCQRTMTSQTATHWSGVEHCTNDGGSADRNLEVVADSPKSISGTMHGKDGDASQHMTFTGKWIAAECGDKD
jgi:hypothetical protein